GTLKSECFYLDEFSNISELKDAVTEYIEYYNSRRISLLDWPPESPDNQYHLNK
ncbi:IS3 family transposase, partial [Escherichia coli]